MTGHSRSNTLADVQELSVQMDSISLAELETLYEELTTRYQAFLHEQDDLEHTVVVETPLGEPLTTSLSGILFHVVNHGTYHRGNITAMLRQLGHASVMQDYVLYMYDENETPSSTS